MLGHTLSLITSFHSHVHAYRNLLEVGTQCQLIPAAAQSKGFGLQALTCWNGRFKSCWGHKYVSLVNAVCCQVEVSALG